MPMEKTTMANEIKSALANKTKQSDAMSALASSIKSYIETNCLILFSWVGISPVGVPDPIVVYEASVTFPSFKIVMNPDSSPEAAMFNLGSQLTTQISGGIITPKISTPPFVVAPTTFLSTSFSLTLSKATDQTNALEYLTNEIILQLKTKINPVPVAGSHGLFVGTGLMTTIQ